MSSHVQTIEHGDGGQMRRWCSCGYRGEWTAKVIAVLKQCCPAAREDSDFALKHQRTARGAGDVEGDGATPSLDAHASRGTDSKSQESPLFDVFNVPAVVVGDEVLP